MKTISPRGPHPMAHSPSRPQDLIFWTISLPHRRGHMLYSTKSFGLSLSGLHPLLRVTSPRKIMNGLPRPIEYVRDPSPHMKMMKTWRLVPGPGWAHEYGLQSLYLRLLDHYLHSDPLHDSLLPYGPRPCEYEPLLTAALKVLQIWALMDRMSGLTLSPC